MVQRWAVWAELTRGVRQRTTRAKRCHEAGMSDLEKVDVLAQLCDVPEPLLSVWLSCCARRAEDLPRAWAPVSVANIVPEVSFAATAGQTAVVE
jgi:hypothetical protein